MKVRQEGDDLGGIWYVFTHADMVDIFNYLLRERLNVRRYKVVSIFKNWRWFKPTETYVVLEKIDDNETPAEPDSIDGKFQKLLRKHIMEYT